MASGGRFDRRKCGVSRFLLLPVATALLLTAGCASSDPPPPSEADQAVEASRAAAAEEQARQEAAGEPERRRRDRSRGDGPEPVREKIVVVSPGGGQRPAPTAAELAEATRAERARLGDRSVGELTDENLAELAKRGKVTYAGDEAGAGGEAPVSEAAGETTDGGEGEEPAAAAETAAETAEAPCGETCWRRRAHDLRLAWSESVDELARLEAEAADLRWRFYAEQDPWVRDSQIKPAWDRTLDRLRLTRSEAERYAERVDELMEQGRRSGALPGWLREGVELEPERTEAEERRRDDVDPAEPVEPTVVEQDARQPTDDPR